MKILMNEVSKKYNELSRERKNYFFTELEALFTFHENNIEHLKTNVTIAMEDKKTAIYDHGKDSYSAKEAIERLSKLKNELKETEISLKFFKEQVIYLIDKRDN